MGRNYIFNLLLTLANILFPIISFPYASRVLGPEGIGKVQFVTSFAQYFALFAALGIPIYGINEIARCRDDKKQLSAVFSELFVIFFATTVLVAVLYYITVLAFPYFSSGIDLYLYGGLIILLGFSYTDWFYSGIEDFKSIALRSIGIKFVSLFFLFFFVRDRSDYLYYLLIMVFSISGNHVAGMLSLGDKVEITFKQLNIRRHIKPLLYIFSTTIAASMYTVLDIVVLGFLANETAVGYYTAAVKLTKITIPLVTSLGVIMIPRLSKHLNESNHDEVKLLLNRAFDFLMLIAVPAVFGLTLLAPEFIEVFSGKEFLDAALSMQILGILPLVIGIGHFFAFLILVPGGYNREMFYSVVAGMVIGLISNVILIPMYSHFGAALANIITEIVVTICYFYYVKKRFDYRYQWILLLKAVLSSLIFIPIVLVIRSQELPLMISLLSAVIACAGLYLICQMFVFRNQLIAEGLASLRLKFKRQEV